jgi:glycosyltransferase involved in cell wall biosynthesis
MTSEVDKLGVVVPAHDEEDHLAECLAALQTAARRSPVPVEILVVLDGCTDDSRAVCERFGVPFLVINERCVGAARAAGFQNLVGGEANPETVWLSSTDADTQVEPTWLRDQVDLARAGADVVLGVVRLSGDAADPELRRAFEVDYRKRLLDDGSHGHVHGANLGIRASVYLRAGGFPFVPTHEDRRLVQRLRHLPDVIIQTSQRLIVSTSGRLEGRCEQGFAATLASLE